jgi:Na+-driven multidrug efflux pump
MADGDAVDAAAMPDRHLDRRIAALAIPALGSIAAEPAYNLVDTAMVGHLGRTPLDALAIATTALMLTAWVAIFLSTATTTAVARLGPDQASKAAGAAYLVGAVGVPAAALLLSGAAQPIA